MTDLAAIKDELRTLLDGLSPTQWADAAVAFTRAVGGEPHDAGLRFFEGVVALLADTPSVEPGGAELARLRQAAATDWHDSTRIKVTAGDLRAVLALLPTQASDSPEKP